ncbi:V-type ATP synthase subunit C [Halorussus gelatinilyticus]|uniref:A-type ATP synthase subunit C n=1 Tax=Halorussus gelatinilyticus TaxID=2937524 RepID=A0A8U0IMU1_9EURY|nr:V-type ATP synthase subunit C [Halorussus gelatinilyticus]UPW01921.1 V-type ATP synthase subunit C [Halorussus gelatinilyticus]
MSVPKSEGTSNYEYVTARVQARRAALFDDEDYRKLVRMGPGEIARYMEETEYETEINALGSRYDGVDLIEHALNRNLAKHFNDLLRWADGTLYELIARYLRKFDAWNVKTVVRGIYSDADREAIEEDLIYAGELDRQFLERLTEAASIEDAVEMLDNTRYGDALAEAYEDYDATGVLIPLENAVDRTYYEGLMTGVTETEDRATQLYVEFLQAEIDFRNARNALRIARSGADLDPADYFIEGGELFRASELSQLAASVDELVTFIRDSTYGEDLSAALDELERADSLIGFEHALDAALLEYSDHLSHVFPLSICPVLAYVLAKEREVDNIRAIARGREAGLSEDEIQNELVML